MEGPCRLGGWLTRAVVTARDRNLYTRVLSVWFTESSIMLCRKGHCEFMSLEATASIQESSKSSNLLSAKGSVPRWPPTDVHTWPVLPVPELETDDLPLTCYAPSCIPLAHCGTQTVRSWGGFDACRLQQRSAE
ncbi:hypothetical protein C8Q76DRAFT_257083 [Earliella scabrosa]|nr:hypothetical protein C8Q76DRAFT_257083 [Earliella scabrosa]